MTAVVCPRARIASETGIARSTPPEIDSARLPELTAAELSPCSIDWVTIRTDVCWSVEVYISAKMAMLANTRTDGRQDPPPASGSE